MAAGDPKNKFGQLNLAQEYVRLISPLSSSIESIFLK